MKKFYFRVDGSRTIGMGHVIRCLALAEYVGSKLPCAFIMKDYDPAVTSLVQKNHEVILLSVELSLEDQLKKMSEFLTDEDAIVVDGYQFNHDFISSLRTTYGFVVYIDDLNQGFYTANVVINHNLHAPEEVYDYDPGTTKILQGVEFVILRSEFDLPVPKTKRSGIIVCLGGSDNRNVSLKMYQALRSFLSEEITIVVGPSNPHLISLQELSESDELLKISLNLSAHEMISAMANSKVFISTASVVSLEACSVGTKLIVGFTEENQRKMSYKIQAMNLGKNLGSLYEQDAETLSKKLKLFFEEDSQEMFTRQKKLFDHQSKERIWNELINAWNRKIN